MRLFRRRGPGTAQRPHQSIMSTASQVYRSIYLSTYLLMYQIDLKPTAPGFHFRMADLVLTYFDTSEIEGSQQGSRHAFFTCT